jgi:site-specific DNA recombinase
VKVIGYVRVSTEEQATGGFSIGSQTEKLKAYCALYDLELVEIITDAGISAKSLNRPGLSAALEQIDAGTAEGLVIAKLDRLTRSVSDWNTLIDDYFKRAALLSVGDQIDTRTAAGRLVLNVLVSVAQWEREAIGERTAAALAHKKALGEHVGAVPFGSQLDGKHLDKCEAEAAVIARVKELRDQGYTYQSLADKLNAEGVSTRRGGKWYPTSIKNIMEYSK